MGESLADYLNSQHKISLATKTLADFSERIVVLFGSDASKVLSLALLLEPSSICKVDSDYHCIVKCMDVRRRAVPATLIITTCLKTLYDKYMNKMKNVILVETDSDSAQQMLAYFSRTDIDCTFITFWQLKVQKSDYQGTHELESEKLRKSLNIDSSIEIKIDTPVDTVKKWLHDVINNIANADAGGK